MESSSGEQDGILGEIANITVHLRSMVGTQYRSFIYVYTYMKAI